MGNQYVVEARGIRKRFGGVLALDGADFLCPVGRIVGLLGENGSGKSTLSKILTGNIPPTEGEILYKGRKAHFASPREAEHAGMAMVYQSFSLVPDLTVWQNIYLGREPLTSIGTTDNKKTRIMAKEYLSVLCSWVDPNTEVRKLLPSEKQLVEIVKALAGKPEFLILDEPTAALESEQVRNLFDLMLELKGRKVSIVYISHRLHEVEEICDHVIVLRNGKTAGTVDTADRTKVNDEEIVRLITGKTAFEAYRRGGSNNTLGGEILRVESLSQAPKLYEVSFRLGKGEIVGLAGLQGQGQEELMLTLSGFQRPDVGKVQLEGRPVTLRHPREAIQKGMVLVPGDRATQGLFMPHSVLHNLTFPLDSLRRSPWVLPSRNLQRLSQGLIQGLSIKTESLATPVAMLSGGNAQKVVLAKWLPLKPKVLLLSDPAKGVDVQAKSDLYRLLARIASEGTAVFLYASDLRELLSVCDRILVIYEGRIVEDLKNENLDEESLMRRCIRSGMRRSAPAITGTEI